jgi:hypothetical protein
MLAKWPSGITGRCFFTQCKPQTTTVMSYNLLKTKAKDLGQSCTLPLHCGELFWCPFFDLVPDESEDMNRTVFKFVFGR